MAQQATLIEVDSSVEGEVSCSTMATDDGTDQEEAGSGDGSHSDEQGNSSTARRSTRKRKPPERYGH